MSTEKKRVLVLGATGEIGSRIARGSLRAGHEEWDVTRGKNTRHHVDTRGVPLVTGDKGHEAFMASLLSQREFDVVIDTVPSVEHVGLAHKYLDGRIEHYLMCSSTGTYPPPQYLPAHEHHPWHTPFEKRGGGGAKT